jgi:integrase/recombinase XerD
VPASDAVLSSYADYQYERAALSGEGTDLVLVTLYHQPLGAAMTYRAAKGFFDRLARGCGFPIRPHMLRHTAATHWETHGIDDAHIQPYSGHASRTSLEIYSRVALNDAQHTYDGIINQYPV